LLIDGRGGGNGTPEVVDRRVVVTPGILNARRFLRPLLRVVVLLVVRVVVDRVVVLRVDDDVVVRLVVVVVVVVVGTHPFQPFQRLQTLLVHPLHEHQLIQFPQVLPPGTLRESGQPLSARNPVLEPPHVHQRPLEHAQFP
jgi:hypothetical protein